MKKVVISDFLAAAPRIRTEARRRPLVSVSLRNCLRGMHGVAEHIKSEEPALVIGVVTEDICLGDLTAVDQLCQTKQLTELASQIDLVALGGDKKNVALATVKHVQELRNINAV